MSNIPCSLTFVPFNSDRIVNAAPDDTQRVRHFEVGRQILLPQPERQTHPQPTQGTKLQLQQQRVSLCYDTEVIDYTMDYEQKAVK